MLHEKDMLMLPTPPIPQELLKAFNDHQHMVILGHKNPDGDCLNSQLALGRVLENRGKNIYLLSPGPFKRYEIQQYASNFLKDFPEGLPKKDTLVIVLDCSTLDRITPFEEKIKDFTTAVIDHHAAGKHFGDIQYIHSRAFSVTFMIQHIIAEMGDELTQEIAEYLLFGLATDTGFFRHIPGKRGEVFHAAAELLEAGASPRRVHELMYGNRPFESRKLLGLLLHRAEPYYEGKLIVTWEERKEHLQFGEEMRDSETLYGQLLGIKGCEMVLYLREDGDNSCTVGLRSNNYVDVGLLASSYGGGGHRRAAGFTYKGEREEIQTTLIQTCKELFL
ncbi:MAG: DHH family phosphoesterase [Spirochaetales bacterium]|nr:DHH family phosphoesterase [Spirochaetales bacterium]